MHIKNQGGRWLFLNNGVMPKSRPRHQPTHQRVGRVIANCREQAGLTQRDLAASLGVVSSTVAKAELGTKNVGLIEFLDWCRACDADPVEIFKQIV